MGLNHLELILEKLLDLILVARVLPSIHSTIVNFIIGLVCFLLPGQSDLLLVLEGDVGSPLLGTEEVGANVGSVLVLHRGVVGSL